MVCHGLGIIGPLMVMVFNPYVLDFKMQPSAAIACQLKNLGN
jgi:hypothetical protein